MAYTTYRVPTDTDRVPTDTLLNRLFLKVKSPSVQVPHACLIIASQNFTPPPPQLNEVYLHTLIIMDLLNQFAYPSITGYAKFGILITMKQSYGEDITFSIGKAIPLTDESGNLLPKSVVYSHIYDAIKRTAEKYEGALLVRVAIRVYLDQEKKKDRPSLSADDRYKLLFSILEEGLVESNALTAREIRHSKRSYPRHITSIEERKTEASPFIVSDLETIRDKNEVHKPYAAGLLLVLPDKDIKDQRVETYYSEDYSISYPEDFEKRSKKVLTDLVLRIAAIAKMNKKVNTIYFHNFSRFDGIILLKHLACNHTDYQLKPLLRNNRLYELSVYSGKKMLFRFRDSLNLLPGKLVELAKSLCPDLGTKGCIDYDKVTVDKLVTMRKELVDYMKQDIYLLGGVLQKAQGILRDLYKVDIESKITLSSLALHIFRLRYYDASSFPIHIPNRNEDNFIRNAYYGGHTDVYKPHGEDLYYYDVNSLYPFIMKEYPMPSGKPTWHGDLEWDDLKDKLGFIEAHVVCPKTINKPLLPYRDKKGILLFPTGEFMGTYYSEELKYAREIGYTVTLFSGYLFDKKESPFGDFVSALFNSRSKAKKEGNEALSYVYKILMNSLYGRFGINPKSTITEICDTEEYKRLLRFKDFIFTDVLTENCHVVSYHSNTVNDAWDPPKNSAVQLAAAITSYARIYMHPYTSREDSYYTDTDSVVLSKPLPEELVSSSILGKFKLEARIREGFFLAPKAYSFLPYEGEGVVRYKGAAKDHITHEWFRSQYYDPDRRQKVNNFRIDWHVLNIVKKDLSMEIGIDMDSKRVSLKNEEGLWVDSEPYDINDISRVNNIGKKLLMKQRAAVAHLQNENLSLHKILSQKAKEMGIDESDKEMKEEPTELTNPTVDEIPRTDKKPKRKAPKEKAKTEKKKAPKKKPP